MRNRSQGHPALVGLDLDAADVAALDGVSTVVDVPEGTVLLRQGTTGGQLIWILSGSADVIRSGTSVATVGPSSVVGEMTMVGDRTKCSADVVAKTPMRLAVLSQAEWRVASSRSPQLAAKLAQIAFDRELALIA